MKMKILFRALVCGIGLIAATSALHAGNQHSYAGHCGSGPGGDCVVDNYFAPSRGSGSGTWYDGGGYCGKEPTLNSNGTVEDRNCGNRLASHEATE
jgi:hypothetical protein